MKTYFYFYFICLFLFTILGRSVLASPVNSTPAGLTSAKIAGFVVSCETLDRNLETGISELSGNVQIIYKDQYFSADYVRIDQKQQTAILDGNVSVKNTLVEIGGDHIEINYEKNTSEITNGYVRSNNIYFTGKKITQSDQNQFHVVDANYTTCNNCPATWSFDGSEIEAEIGGYAFLKNSFLKLSGIPVFWLPYLIVPLKNERQTGFLAPEIGYIRERRLVYSQSLFVALSRSQDLTFTFKNYEFGGLKKQIEYRYAATEKTFGQFTFSHINDSLFSTKKRYTNYVDPNNIDTQFNRWSLRGYNQFEINSSEKLRLNLNQTSDIEYPLSFNEEFSNYADSALENRINYTNNSNDNSFSVDAIYYKHLLSANALSNNESAVHQLPEIKYDTSIKKIADTDLYYKFNFNYTNFYRKSNYDDISFFGSQRYVTNSVNDPTCENGVKDSTGTKQLVGNCKSVSDGTYNENTDIMRTGQRLIYKATVLTPAYSISDTVNISPEISYNESHYLFNTGSNKYSPKRYLEFDLLSRSKLFRIYESDTKKYKHEFIPELSYRWIPWIQENTNSFFGTNSENEIPVVSKSIISDNDLNNENKIQFDYQDRIYDRNLITLTLLNRVIEKDSLSQIYKNIFDIQIKQSYDLYQALYGKNRNEPFSDLSSTMNLYLNEFTISNQSNYYPYLSATNSSTTLTYLNSMQQYFKIGLISKRTEDPKQDDVSLALGFVSTYINLLTGVVLDTSENRQSSSRVKKVSLITQIKPPGECWAINFYQDQKVGKDVEWKLRFDFSWDGKPTKIIPPNELNIN